MNTAMANANAALNRAQQGLRILPGKLGRREQILLLDAITTVMADAPPFTPVMPRSGRPFSVRMTNCGLLGWVSDRSGYRYQECHPETGKPWPTMPVMLTVLWHEVTGYEAPPEACLVNIYRSGARMGLHRDENEEDMAAPVVSISLGDAAIFRIGGHTRRGKTRSLRLSSGDVLVMGGQSRLCFHGIDRILPDSSELIPGGGRINVTLRRVTLPAKDF